MKWRLLISPNYATKQSGSTEFVCVSYLPLPGGNRSLHFAGNTTHPLFDIMCERPWMHSSTLLLWVGYSEVISSPEFRIYQQVQVVSSICNLQVVKCLRHRSEITSSSASGHTRSGFSCWRVECQVKASGFVSVHSVNRFEMANTRPLPLHARHRHCYHHPIYN